MEANFFRKLSTMNELEQQIPNDDNDNSQPQIHAYTISTKFMQTVKNKNKSSLLSVDRIQNRVKKMASYQRSDLMNLKSLKVSSQQIKEMDQICRSQKKWVEFNGNKIYGGWKNKKLHGEVRIYYKTGDQFKGTYENGERIHGILKYSNGSEYVGNFKSQKFHGHGSLTDPNKRKVICDWNEGNAGKKGKIIYKNEDVYCGEIKNLKKHGEGYIFFKNGDRFMGNFMNGKIYGQGKLYKNDQKVAEGFWIDGALQDSDPLNFVVNQILQSPRKKKTKII